jgi:hypothetical protein
MEKCIEEIINSKPGEEVQMVVRKHWLVFAAMSASLFFILVLPLVVLFIIGIYFPVIYSGFYFSIVVVFAFAYLLLLLANFLFGYIKFYFDIVIVTNKRIIDIDQVGFFNRNIEELELLHIENVSASVKGMIQTFFNFGNVVVETAAEHPNFNFQSIPNPQEFTRKVMQLYEDLISNNHQELETVDKVEGLARWDSTSSQPSQPSNQAEKNNPASNEQKQSETLKPGEEKKLDN